MQVLEEKKDKNEMDNTKKKSMIIPEWDIDSCVYTSCFCEENVWKLCERTRKENFNLDDFYVIFLSNQHKQFPIWNAKSAESTDAAVIWDYHVIYLWINKLDKNKSLIFDLDSRLSFGSLINEYIVKSFRPDMVLKDEYKHNFRVLSAKEYLDKFYSDRKHMYQNKKWLAKPPKYKCIMIKNKKKGSNLMSHFVNMNNKQIGKIFNDPIKLYQWVITQ